MTPEQTPERIELPKGRHWTDKELLRYLPSMPLEKQIEVVIGKFVGGAGSRYHDGETDALTADRCIARELVGRLRKFGVLSQLDALIATLAHLTQRKAELEALALSQERVRALWERKATERSEQAERAEQAEATLARVKALCSGEPVTDGGLPADGVIYPGDPAHCDVCAALVDPLVSSSTENT